MYFLKSCNILWSICFTLGLGIVEESADIYTQLAEKDHYLMLAAEAGKVLLEKNQELEVQYEALHTEYLHKIEVRF